MKMSKEENVEKKVLDDDDNEVNDDFIGKIY